MDEYCCSGCGFPLTESAFHKAGTSDRRRPVRSRCRSCRREDYYTARYPDVCACCQKHRPVEAVGMCRACLDAQGLRLCRACGEVLPLLFKFYGTERKCKDCRKNLTTDPGGSKTGT